MLRNMAAWLSMAVICKLAACGKGGYLHTPGKQHGEPSVFPCGGVQRLASALLELYGDEWLLIPAMHYRWHHNREWALRAFGALNAPEASPEEQLELGTLRAAPFAQAAVLLGAMPHMHAAIERSYEDLLAELNAHFAKHPYLLGARPSIGDFGLYGPLYAHQYRDPASGALMRRLAPHVVAWVERMQQPPTPRSGDSPAGVQADGCGRRHVQRLFTARLRDAHAQGCAGFQRRGHALPFVPHDPGARPGQMRRWCR
jgi:glutathione S-transferase